MSDRGAPTATPERIVSLVPSLTEACFSLGLGASVVGVTSYCVHPRDAVAALPKVGGTKDADVDAIAALEPDLVIANQEENTRRTVEALERRGLRVWVSYPRTLDQGADTVRALARVSPDSERARALVDELDDALAQLEANPNERSRGSRPRVFCPIWRDPWMVVGADTYASDLIERCGGANPFAARADRARGLRRYPIVSLDEVVAARPDVVLLPDEPYAFGARDAAELATLDIPAARWSRIHSIDGTWVTWYGPRIARAVREIRRLLAPPPLA